MSQLAPCGRATPRWSVLGGGQPAAASIAGLPTSGARVSRKLGPGELNCSGPRRGSVFGRSPATVGVQELPLSMLLPSDVMPPVQLSGVLAARMVFRTSTVPVPLLEVPPPALAPLPATVLLSRRAEPSFQRAPPTPGVLLSARVALVRVVTPSFHIPAPLPPAVLRLIVPLTTSSELLFQRAPPSVAGAGGVGGFVLSREAKASFRTPPPSAVLVLPSIVKLPRTEMDAVFEKPPPSAAMLFRSTPSMR